MDFAVFYGRTARFGAVKLGFVEIPVGETLYSRANYKAEMYL